MSTVYTFDILNLRVDKAAVYVIANNLSDNRNLITLSSTMPIVIHGSEGETDNSGSSDNQPAGLPLRSPRAQEFLDSLALSDGSSTAAQHNHLPPSTACGEYFFACSLQHLSPFYNATVV